MGANLIAQHLNEHHAKLATTSKGWHKSYVEKILNHPATFGAYQPCKRIGNHSEPDGDLVQDFFPAAIDYSTFKRAQDARSARYRKRKGRAYPEIRNLFAGLVRDATHSLPMSFYWRGKELVTDSYRVGKRPHRIPYPRFEKAFLRFLDELDVHSILGTSDSDDLRTAEKDVADTEAAIALSQERIDKMVNLLLDTPSDALKAKLIAEEQALKKARADLSAAQEKANNVRATHRDLLDKSVVYSKLAKATDVVTRARLREEIRRKVQRVDIHFKGYGERGFRADITFVNGAVKKIVAVGVLPVWGIFHGPKEEDDET
jgi:hypothetical protein